MRVRRAALTALALTALIAGCTSGNTEPTTTIPPMTASPSPTSTQDAAADEAAVLETYYAYWDAVVANQAGDVDGDVYAGVAEGPFVEEWMNNSRELAEFDLVREGEPSFSDVRVEVHGDRATVAACVDFSKWIVRGPVKGDGGSVLPGAIEFARSGDTKHGWLAVRDNIVPPTDMAC